MITGKTPNTSIREYYENEYMFIGPTDLHKHFFIYESEKKISEKGLNSIKSSTLDGVSILVGCIGWGMGNVGLVKEKCATNQQINSITNINQKYNPYYIYYWLKGKKDFLFKQATVTRTPILKKSRFSEIKINIPKDKKRQDLVAKFLTSLDQKIEINNQINARLEAMAKTLYDYWFVQFDFPDENGKPYKSSGGKMVYNEALKREIPEGWECYELSDVIERIGTGLNPRQHFSLGQGSNYYVTIKSIDEGKILLDDKCDKIDDETLKIINRRSDLRVGDILFTSIQPVGITYLIQEKPKNWNINESVFSIRPNHEVISSEYAYLLLGSKGMKAFTKNASAGSIHKGIRIGVLKTFKFAFGGEEIIRKFSEIVAPQLAYMHKIEKENQELIQLRDWLLPMLMNGQVKVEASDHADIEAA